MTILIAGKQGEGKSRLAVIVIHIARLAGLTVEVYTTNKPIDIPIGAELEVP